MLIDVNAHPLNAPVPMLVTELGISTDFRPHPSNAPMPMLVTELGIFIDVRLLQP